MSWEMTADVKRFLSHCRIAGVKYRHAAVLYPLADECRPGHGACCQASYQRIALAARMSRKSAIRILAELTAMTGEGFEDGLIRVIRRRRPNSRKAASNRYDLSTLASLGRLWQDEDKASQHAVPVDDDDLPEDVDGDNLTPPVGDSLTPTDGDNLTPTDADEGEIVPNVGPTAGTNVGPPVVPGTYSTTEPTTTGDGSSSPDKSVNEKKKGLAAALETRGVWPKAITACLTSEFLDTAWTRITEWDEAKAADNDVQAGLLVDAITEGYAIKRPERKGRRSKAKGPQRPNVTHLLYRCLGCETECVTTVKPEYHPTCRACAGKLALVRKLKPEEVEVTAEEG